MEVWRAKNPAAVPFRLVLEDVDQSTFVVPTTFDYIVCAESDGVGKNPPVISGIWLCAIPYNPTTRIDGGTIVVKPFGDHFYFIEQTL